MIDGEELKIVIEKHQIFYSIAWHQYTIINKLVLERTNKNVKNNKDVYFICLKNAEIQRASIIVVIFCALTLEGFINSYGIQKFSKTYFKKHLDKLNPISKFILIPKLITGKQIDTDSQAYDLLQNLFKLRDKLAHYKTKKKKICDLNLDEDWITEKHASAAIIAVNKVIQKFKKIEPTFDIEWLEKAKKYDIYYN